MSSPTPHKHLLWLIHLFDWSMTPPKKKSEIVKTLHPIIEAFTPNIETYSIVPSALKQIILFVKILI
jgi:hypothetical protein